MQQPRVSHSKKKFHQISPLSGRCGFQLGFLLLPLPRSARRPALFSRSLCWKSVECTFRWNERRICPPKTSVLRWEICTHLQQKNTKITVTSFCLVDAFPFSEKKHDFRVFFSRLIKSAFNVSNLYSWFIGKLIANCTIPIKTAYPNRDSNQHFMESWFTSLALFCPFTKPTWVKYRNLWTGSQSNFWCFQLQGMFFSKKTT